MLIKQQALPLPAPEPDRWQTRPHGVLAERYECYKQYSDDCPLKTFDEWLED